MNHKKRKCHETKDFLTKDQAHARARRMKQKGYLIHAYKCPYCKGWHVGKNKIESEQRIFKILEKIENAKT